MFIKVSFFFLHSSHLIPIYQNIRLTKPKFRVIFNILKLSDEKHLKIIARPSFKRNFFKRNRFNYKLFKLHFSGFK